MFKDGALILDIKVLRTLRIPRFDPARKMTEIYNFSLLPYKHCRYFNSLWPSGAYMRQWTKRQWFRQWLVARSPIIWTSDGILLVVHLGTNFSEIFMFIHVLSRKCISKCRLENGSHFVSASMCKSHSMKWRLKILEMCHWRSKLIYKLEFGI